jgi:site-specific DNA recombinase
MNKQVKRRGVGLHLSSNGCSPEAEPKRAAIYARVSSTSQHTIESQLFDLPKIAAANGWELVGAPYVDDGVSGAVPGPERPGMRALLADLEPKRIGVVCIVGWSRLGREDNLLDRALVIGELQRRGVLVSEGHTLIDLTSPEGELYAVLQSCFASMERKEILKRTARGRRRILAEGKKPAGPVPYGYRYEHSTGAWTIDPVEGPVVAEMFRRVLEGHSCRKIADDFDMRGISPRARRRDARRTWKPERILYIIHSTAYRGVYPVDKEKEIFLPVPPIVDEQVWMTAQGALNGRMSRPARAGHVKPFLLRDLLSCALCGQHVRTLSRPRGNSYYVCRAKVTQGFYGACEARWHEVSDVDDRVYRRVVGWLMDESEAVARLLASGQMTSLGGDMDERKVKSMLRRLDRSQTDVFAQFRRGIITAAVRDAELEAVAVDRREFEAKLARLAQEQPPTPRMNSKQIKEALGTLRELAGAEAYEDRRELLEILVPCQGIALARDAIEVTVNLGALMSVASGSPGRTYQDEHAFEIRLAA